ncbi:MAG: lamin tail domain-containing protein [Candidatus Moraniibacteriota bacterium]
MQNRLIWLLTFPVLLLGLLFPFFSFAASEIFLTQIQIEGDKADDEFVELYNSSDTPVNLSGWSIRRKSKGDATVKGTSLKTFGAGDVIPTHGYYLWSNSQGIFKDLADVTTSSGLTNDNSLGLFDKTGGLIDSVTWGSGHALPFSPSVSGNPGKKERLLRDKATFSWSLSQISEPTNSLGIAFEEEKDEPVPPPPAGPFFIRINEVFPNPDAKNDSGEFIELYNYGEDTIDLSDWTLHDATKTGKYLFPAASKLAKDSYLVLTDSDFTFSLNNTTEALSLFDNFGNIIHSVNYEKTKEGISLNLVDGKLKGSQRPTPGEANLLDTDPETREKVPKKGFRGMPVNFDARGKDADGDKLKYTWSFGDGHKSYKEKTSHKYEERGVYTVTLTTDDGKNATTETFLIKIGKYEYPEIRITAFLPNPAGKDAENEWVEIENRGKKEVNLKGFGIATGTKSLVNHPIRDDFVIPKKSKKKVTREDSLLVLGNVKGKIELRAPDGKVLQKLKYKFPKSLGDDVVLTKEKGKGLIAVPVAETIPEPEEIPEPQEENEKREPALTEVPEANPGQGTDEEPASSTAEPEVLGASTNTPFSIDGETKNEGPWKDATSFFWEFIENWNEKLNNLFSRS